MRIRCSGRCLNLGIVVLIDDGDGIALRVAFALIRNLSLPSECGSTLVGQSYIHVGKTLHIIVASLGAILSRPSVVGLLPVVHYIVAYHRRIGSEADGVGAYRLRLGLDSRLGHIIVGDNHLLV